MAGEVERRRREERTHGGGQSSAEEKGAAAPKEGCTWGVLPKLSGQQIEEARRLFRLVGELRDGGAELPWEMSERLAYYHLVFAASTECEVWRREWDRIIDEAEGLVHEGAQRVVKFIEKELVRAGFPEWAKKAVADAIAVILGLGEARLYQGLELARLSGKLGLWLRCHWPF